MSITNDFARLAADALIAFSRAPILYFSAGRNGRGEAIRVAKLGGDTVERVDGSDTVTIRSAAGRIVTSFAIGADGLPTVDAGGGPTQLDADLHGQAGRLVASLRDILAATRPIEPIADAGGERPLAVGEPYRESDGSTWVLLHSEEMRDEDRAAHGHELGLDEDCEDDSRLDDATERMAMLSLRTPDGQCIATAVIDQTGLLGLHPKDYEGWRDWKGLDVMSMRLSYSESIEMPLEEGRHSVAGSGDTVHVDAYERFHNLFGPAFLPDEYSDADTLLWAVNGEDLCPDRYPYAAAAAAEDAGLLSRGSEDRNTRWLRRRVEELVGYMEQQLETDAFEVEVEEPIDEDDEPTGFLVATEDESMEGFFSLVGRLADNASMENVEAMQVFAFNRARGISDPASQMSVVEAAIATGLIKADRADPDELADLTRGKKPPKGMSPRLRELSAEQALEALPAVLRAAYGMSGWDEVEVVLPVSTRSKGPKGRDQRPPSSGPR